MFSIYPTLFLIYSNDLADDHPPLVFNNNNVSEANSQKHLGIALDNLLSFEGHLNVIVRIVNKTTEYPAKKVYLTCF